nr:MAG TPA: protein of unknown function DUF4376 [Bacteriophage sp.]
MEEHVTVIPGDGVISVNGIPMQFKFPPVAGHEKVHAIQWHYGSGTLELDGFTGEPLTAADYDRAVAPYVQFWTTEKARREAEKAAQEAEYNRIENVKARKLAELNRAMEEAKVSSSVSIKSSVGYTVNANTTAKQNVDGLITAMTATGRDTVSFMTFDNQLVELTLEQLKAIQLELISYGNNLYARKWALRSQIEACATKKEVDAIVISYADVTA